MCAVFLVVKGAGALNRMTSPFREERGKLKFRYEID